MKHIRFFISIILISVIILSSQSFALSSSALEAYEETQSEEFLGDVNSDGLVTAVDARMILRYTAGLIDFDEKSMQYADCNEDGAVTAVDARIVLQITAGLINPINPDVKEEDELREDWVKDIADKVSYDEVFADLKWLVDDIGVRSWWDLTQNNAGGEIYKKLLSYGYTSTSCKKIEFRHNDVKGINLLATIPTAKENPDILLFMAHYDTVRKVSGAVDNASGVVTLLQAAKIFLQSGKDYGVEIRFLFTAGEEQFFYGARNYARSLSAEEKSRHKMIFNVDMTAKPNDNYKPGEKYYLAVSTEPVETDLYTPPTVTKANMGSAAIDSAKVMLGNIGEDGYFSPIRAGISDIIPFRAEGIETVSLSWRCIDAERSKGADFDLACPPNNHLPEDNVENTDIDSLYNTTRLTACAAAQLIFPYMDQAQSENEN